MAAKKSMLYKKLFLTYTLVVIGLIGGFDLYLIHYVRSNTVDSRMYLGERLASDVSEILKEIEHSNKLIVNEMYYDPMLTKDIINFLEYNTNDYLKNKLDSFSSNNTFTYAGVEKFVSHSFLGNEKMERIIFISKSLQEIRAFNKLNQIYTEPIMDYEQEMESLSHIFFQENHLYYVNAINNPDTLIEEGKLIVSYNLSEINTVVSDYGMKYGVSILDDVNQTVYPLTNGTSVFNSHQLDQLINLADYEKIKLNHSTNAFKVKFSDNLSILLQISMKNLIESQVVFYSSIILLDSILIILALSILKFKLDKLTKRTDQILQVMEEVKEGNLKVQIPIDNESDEISYISQHFNEMCIELSKYIHKSYLAEINQKKAEMIALQNQVNPHFLYNTLECIRMKAICNGDKDVGKMLYHLSFLFRKQLKDSHRITIKSELEYCKRYMEIFKFRYREKFNFNINCPDELLDYEIIKFTIQPLIENYFIHGIKLEETNNYIVINVIKEKDEIKMLIDDNGRGIPEGKLKEINESLCSELQENIGERSIGIINAHARIVGAYGERYGIKLGNNNQGARITIRIPMIRGGNNNEKSHVS